MPPTLDRGRPGGLLAIVVAVAFALVGCTSGSHPTTATAVSADGTPASTAAAQGPVTVTVTPEAAFTATLAGRGELSGPVGAVTARGRVTLTTAPSTVGAFPRGGFTAVGDGVNVTFADTQPRTGLT